MSIRKFLYVPEDWSRDYESRSRTPKVVSGLMGTINILILVAITVLAIISWSRKHFNRAGFVIVLLFGLLIYSFKVINGFPLQIANFTTSQPWKNQLTMIFSSGIIRTIISTMFISFIAGWATYGKAIKGRKGTLLIHSIAWAFIFIGIKTFVTMIVPQIQPIKTSVASPGTSLPIFDNVLVVITSFLTQTAVLLAFVKTLNLLNTSKTGRNLSLPIIILVSLLYFGQTQLQLFNGAFLIGWIVSSLSVSLLAFIAYKQLLRYDISAVVIISFTISILPKLKWSMSGNYPHQFIGILIGILVSIPIALLIKGYVKK